MSKNEQFEVGAAARWYALVVKHQYECRLQKYLDTKGWETLVPTYRSQRQWSDRVKEIELPLFTGYVFCRFAAEQRIHVEDTPGVMRIVGFGGVAAPLNDRDVAEIRTMVASKATLSPWPYLKAGDRVLVAKGPLKGLEGTLLRDGNNTRLIVGVELLQRSVAAEIDPSMVVPLRSASAVA